LPPDPSRVRQTTLVSVIHAVLTQDVNLMFSVGDRLVVPKFTPETEMLAPLVAGAFTPTVRVVTGVS